MLRASIVQSDPQEVQNDVVVVESLDETMTGVWLVETLTSVHVWDLDDRTYTHRPQAAAGGLLRGGAPMPITHIETWPSVGSAFFVRFADPSDLEHSDAYELSSRVLRIHPASERSAVGARSE